MTDDMSRTSPFRLRAFSTKDDQLSRGWPNKPNLVSSKLLALNADSDRDSSVGMRVRRVAVLLNGKLENKL